MQTQPLQKPQAPRTKVDLTLLNGNFAYIYEHLCPTLASALANPGKHSACPVHGGTDGFRLLPDFNKNGVGICNSCGTHIGINLIAWANGWTGTEAFVEVCKLMGLGSFANQSSPSPLPLPKPNPHTPPTPTGPTLQEVLQKNKARVSKILANTVRLTPKSPANNYLLARGIWLNPNKMPKLGFCKQTPYFDPTESTPCLQHLPAIIAKVETLNGTLGALHRIYLDPVTFAQKASIRTPKQLTGKIVENLLGCAIQLYQPTGSHLCLAEGIETALAVHSITGAPTWACVTAGMLEEVRVPPHVTKVSIFADLDAVSGRGQAASLKLAARLRQNGVQVEELLPPAVLLNAGEKGIDWLDVLVRCTHPKEFVQSAFIK